MSIDADTINSVYPISEIEIYPNGTIITKRKCKLQAPPCGRRNAIKSFSSSSLNRVAFLVRETEVKFVSMLTLSYPEVYPQSGLVCKLHLNKLLVWMRTKRHFEYIWFIEFQKRGAPHFHVLCDFMPLEGERRELAAKWAKYVASKGNVEEFDRVFKVHFHKRAWEAIRKGDGAARYITKYATKQEQKNPGDFMDVGRFWGASRGVKNSIPEPFTRPIGEDELRGCLHTDGSPVRGWDVLPKYIYVRGGNSNYI